MTFAEQVAKRHIALLPSPGIGHLIPLLEFAKHLVVNQNVHVSFLVISSGEVSAIQDQLLHDSTLPPDLHVIHLPQVNISPSLDENTSLITQLSRICQESLKHLSKTLELNLPKALVIDMFTTDAIPVCKDLGVPVYSFFTCSTKALAWAFYVSRFKKECGRDVPGCASLGIDELPGAFLNMGDEDMRHFTRLTMVSGIFVNTWEDLESKSSWLNGIKNDPFYKTLPAPPVYPVGPLIKRDEAVAKSHDYIVSWLDNQSPNSVLLVSLGSGGTLTSEQMRELALGLEMSKQKFVWVVRKPNDFTSSGTFFNAGRDEDDPLSYLPEGFVERTAGAGLVVPSWAPQVAILRHEATGGFLSHCGWNSTLESLVHGIPMIAWPLYAEQKMNAASLIKEIEIAVKPSAVDADAGGKRVVKREEVERVVRLLMESEQGKLMRVKANELKETAAKAMKPGGSSYELVSSIVKSWN
uniref:Glycosyltransferase n=1 Tax=Daucus carota subsp. sativus TaxID=79200 RepID=A0A164WEI4_DAUCS|nr:PREDICTED: anthocyanidin 3-O-glucosyltransferase 5-like [Daucus carota subsp. sativus]